LINGEKRRALQEASQFSRGSEWQVMLASCVIIAGEIAIGLPVWVRGTN